MRKLISMIVPCFNEEAVFPEFLRVADELSQEMNYTDFEFLFIDDGSKDNTLKLIKEANSLDSRIRFISFSRNFGKEAGIYAGLEAAKGDYVVVLDADLQHPPHYIKDMYETLEQGEYDCVAMYRTTRKGEKPVRSFFSGMFYKLMNKLSHLDLKEGATDYRMMTRLVVNSILGLTEYNRFTKGIYCWVGFKTLWMPYENVERTLGESKWSLKSLFRYSLEGITAFSTGPLVAASGFGIFFCFLAFLLAIWVVIKTCIWGDPVAGFPSLFCMMLLLGGLQLLFMGIQGQYLSKMYLETKRRPVYIVRESSDTDNQTDNQKTL